VPTACLLGRMAINKPPTLPNKERLSAAKMQRRASPSRVMVGVSFMCSRQPPPTVVGRLVRLCASYAQLHVHVNCFDSGPNSANIPPAFEQLRGRCQGFSASSIPGMKGLFWKLALPPLHVAASDYIWLVDADMDFGASTFNLSQVVHEMRASGAALAQPRISSKPGGGRTTDFPALRESNTPISPGCNALLSPLVEVQTPIFLRSAWYSVWTHLLQTIPDRLLAKSVWLINRIWCSLLQSLGFRVPCALLRSTLVHLDEHLIEQAGLTGYEENRSKTGWGLFGAWRKARVNTFDDELPRFLNESFGARVARLENRFSVSQEDCL